MGRLGKPQRSKKHKKIKAVDPFYVGPRSVDRNASGINQAPKGDDEDSYLPGSVKEIMKLRKQAKKIGKKEKKNKFKKHDIQEYTQDPIYNMKAKGMTRPLKAAPVFKQREGESEIGFMYRMDRETQAVIKRTQFEDKYNVDIEETESGEVKVKKRRTEAEAEKLKEKRKSKNQKKAEKRKEKHINKLKTKVENFEEFQDEVKFGEVAMAPPTLTAKPRSKGEPKTSQVQSLLLNDMMNAGPSKKETTKREVGQVMKRKHMSIAQQRITDLEREKAISTYRELKKQKKGD